VSDDDLQIVKSRLPFERRTDTVAGGDELRWITCTAGREFDLKIDAGHALHGLDHIQHGETATISTIERRGGPATAQVSKRIGVCGDSPL
jgi:hypothetical protein